MIITQSGVSSPFAFAGSGDEFVVTGVITNLGDTGTDVILSALAGNKITNQGQISSFGAGSAISLALGGTVANSGVISGALVSLGPLSYLNAATGRHSGFIQVSQEAASTGSTLTNRGTLVFADMAGNVAHVANAVIALADSNDMVVNSGKITGDILMGGGNDVFDGRGGQVLGVVNGGTGDDLYYISQTTTIADSAGYDTVNARTSATLAAGIERLVISGYGNFSGIGNTLANTIIGNGSSNLLDGAAGDDTIAGGGGTDKLLGGTGNDSLDGQIGADTLLGGGGADALIGGDGDDRLFGETGNDSLSGGLGADRLDGGIGADSLLGDDGDDVLIGGAFGTDRMTGGAGLDRFTYLTAQDSFATAAADVITDFTQGEDRIDLSALVAGDFIFMGSDPFSTSQASVRATVLGDKTAAQFDLNHDGTADMQVFLSGIFALTAADFLL